MSTTLPGSFSDDFKQSMIILWNTRPGVNSRKLGAIERLKDTTQRIFLQYRPISNMVNQRWSESWCPPRCQVYYEYNFGKSRFG